MREIQYVERLSLLRLSIRSQPFFMPTSNMASSSIKLFQFIQKFCRTIGIYSPKPNQNRYRYSSMNWFTIFCFDQFIISTASYLLFEADSMSEYSITLFICLITIGCKIFSLIAFWQVKSVSECVENWEKFIEKSKS